MRRAIVLAAATLLGAVVAMAGVSASYWWGTRHVTSQADFGFSAYSKPRPFVDYLPVSATSTDWAGLLLPAAVVGAAVGLLLGGVALLVHARTGNRRQHGGQRL